MWYKLLSVVFAVGLIGASAGCERERKVAEETEIDEGLFGDTEIERREVFERNGQYETREETTTLDSEGRVKEREVEVDRPDRGTDVNINGGRDGVDVDVQTRD